MLLSYFDNSNMGSVVLFVHGTASTNEIWEKQYKLLNQSNCRVIGVDLRGHGSSKAQEGICTVNDHVNDLKETLDYIGIKEPVTIIGHSFGGVIALRFAEKFPSLVNKLLLVSLPPKVPRILLRFYRWLLGKPIELLQKKINIILKLPLKKKHKLAVSADLNIIRQIWKDSHSWDFLTQVPKLSCPVYLSVGRFDYVALSSMVKRLHKVLPNSSYKVFNWAAHTCMDDQPAEFNKWLLSVLGLHIIQLGGH